MNRLELPTIHNGFSLIELLTAMTLGLFLAAGLVTVFSNSSSSYSELKKTGQRNENGRYALKLLRQDLAHAGYYGHYYTFGEDSTLPNPCSTDVSVIQDSLSFPVQGYNDVSSSPIDCLSDDNLVSDTDILVVRRASTVPLQAGDTPTLNDVYIQANFNTGEIQLGQPTNFSVGSLADDNTVANVGTTADGQAPSIKQKANVDGASPTITSLRLAADIRKLHVHIYFLAPCLEPADGSNVCTGSQDDNGSPTPTLKRLELTSAGGETTFSIVPLVEGIDNFQVDYGIDTSSEETVGYGSVNNWEDAPSASEFYNVVTTRIHLLLRNPEQTNGYTDDRTYNLGIYGPTDPANDAYKRHVYTGLVRLHNVSGRREVPL